MTSVNIKTLEEIHKLKGELAEKDLDDVQHHRFMMAADYTTRSAYIRGFDACMKFMLEREKVAKDCIEYLSCFIIDYKITNEINEMTAVKDKALERMR